MLYDGLCPICVTEIRFLQFLQKKQPDKVDFVDISLSGYDGEKYKGVSYEMAMEEMHVIDEKDEVNSHSTDFTNNCNILHVEPGMEHDLRVFTLNKLVHLPVWFGLFGLV